ncbi:MAG TPA: CheR family methyltransferase [Burkholderiaceae bacterium]
MDALTPDEDEEAAAERLDDVVPTRGYELLNVVGLGGSAGGIAALRQFFEIMPADSGMAFVVIVHLSSEHESLLADVLQRCTAMRVVQVQENARLEPDTVYVIPPRKALTTRDGSLQLAELQVERGKHVAVDLFFRALADSHGPHASAIVLSGGDGDGAIGIKRIKERGGLTIVQDPKEAEQEGMPRSAFATGMVDWVLPVAEMPARLLAYHRLEPRLRLPPEDGPQPAQPVPVAPAADEGLLRDILSFLRVRTGRDFSYYKRATIVRRIGRRMQVNGVEDMAAYLDCLRTRSGEAGALLQDLLISVTNFFRDADCFEALESHIPDLFRNKSPSDSVRVWVTACATGEEAYSVAMLLHEHARTLEAPPLIQVFATDLDEDAVQSAREGVYPATIEADVSDDRLRHFFTRDQRGYRVRRELRETVLFAVHDLLKDSPFSRLDLVTCRNLLIYLTRDAQARAIDIFHFALRTGGRLFLGSSESVDDESPLFSVLDKKHRLYAHRPALRTVLPIGAGPGTLALAYEAQQQAAEGASLASRLVERSAASPALAPGGGAEPRNRSWGDVHLRLLEHFAPPSVLINSDHAILHLSANAGRFLRFRGGEPSTNLLDAVHPSLRIELRALLSQTMSSGHPAEAARLPLDLHGARTIVTLRVSPAPDIGIGLYLVVLQPETVDDKIDGAELPIRAEPDLVAQQLDRELERLKAHLQDTVEQYEASTEELKASNEELQAMNEELRSATEELETSREELQSINEELTTVNHELKIKVDELGHSNSDMHNLMDATAIATIFLDRELCITRYTPSAVTLFNLIPTDVGRPLTHLSTQLNYPTLVADAGRVLEHLVPIEREVDGRGGWYLARLRPYRTIEDRIAGVVLSFVDITERKQTDAALQHSGELMRLVIDNARDYAIFSTDLAGGITGWNTGAQRLLGYDEKEVLGRPAHVVFTDEDRAAGVPERELATARETGRASDDRFHQRKDGSRFWASGVLMAMHEDVDGGPVIGYVKILRDQTEARQAQQALELSQQQLTAALAQNEGAREALENASAAKDQFLAVLSHELRTPLTPVVLAVHMLSRRGDLPPGVRETLDVIHRNIRVEAHLIDDLLDLTRIARGSLDILHEPVDMHEIIRNAVEISMPDISGKQQELTLALDAPVHRLTGDAHRLQQLFWNLLKNSSKFSPMQGHIEIATRIEGEDFIATVTDDGVGIDTDALPRIFDAFTQGGTWVTQQFGGLGLGLSISKATAAAHGGQLRAASDGRDQGAQFTVQLPLKPPPRPDEPQPFPPLPQLPT